MKKGYYKFLFFGLALIIFLLELSYCESEAQKARKKVSHISITNFQLHNKVKKVVIDRGPTYLFLDDDRVFLLPDSRNYANGSNGDLTSFIHGQDSVFKKANNDTLYIYKIPKWYDQNKVIKEYYFVLGKKINKHLKEK